MTAIFVSYSREDKDFVDRLVADLRSSGYEFWVDVGKLRTGQEWSREIDRALRACDIFMVIVSPDSMESEWVYREAIMAIELKKTIVPVLRRTTSIPVHLQGIQYADFRRDYATGLDALRSALHIPAPPAPHPDQEREASGRGLSQGLRRYAGWIIASALIALVLGCVGAAALWIYFSRGQGPLPTNPAPSETPPPAPATSTSPSPPAGGNALTWTIVEDRIVIDPIGKYWEKYEADTASLPGLFLRTDDINSFGDYLELNSDGTFVMEEGGEMKTGTWSLEGDAVLLEFSQGG